MATTSEQAANALASVDTSIQAADQLLAAFKYENAVSGYQGAGNQAIAIKPLLGAPSSVAYADTLNAGLQALQSHLADQATAKQAQTLAKQIEAVYRQAIGTAAPVVFVPGATSSANSGPSPWLWVGLLGVAAVGALLLWPRTKNPAKNPLTGEARGPSRGQRRLIAKGRSVFFELADGREVKAHGAMLHDPSGRAWPKNSVLFAPIRRGSRRVERDDDASRYFGSSYQAKAGSVNLPPRGLAGWQRVGTVTRIYYTRGGRSHPGRYEHEFKGSFFRGGGRATLYRRGRYYRLQLPRNAVMNERGYVYP